MNFLKNRKILILLFLQIFVLSSLVSYTITTTQAKTNSTNVTDSTTTVNLTNVTSSLQNADLVAIYEPNAATTITQDGVMGANEYPEQFYSNYTGMTVAMAYNGTSLFVFVSAPTAGWVGVGFNTLGYGMIGADVKVGAVYDNSTGAVNNHVYDSITNSTTWLNDMYTTQYSFPSPDQHNDVTAFNGTESLYINGASGTNRTNLEFVMNMVPTNSTDTTPIPGDSYPPITQDKILTPGDSYSLLLAYGRQNDDGLNYKHINKTIATLYIAPENIGPRTSSNVKLQLDQTTGEQNSTLTGTVTLTMDNGTAIANASVGIYQVALIGDLNLETVVTDQNGQAQLNFSVYQEYSANVKIQAKFLGDSHFKKDFSSYSIISYTGTVPTQEAPFLIIPTTFDFLVPWLTGLGAVATVACIWMAFGYVIYTVLYKNAVQPNAKKSKGE